MVLCCKLPTDIYVKEQRQARESDCPFYLEHNLEALARYRFKNYLLVPVFKGREYQLRSCYLRSEVMGRFFEGEFYFDDGYHSAFIWRDDVEEIS